VLVVAQITPKCVTIGGVTLNELQLLRERIPDPLDLGQHGPDVTWWNTDRELALATIEQCNEALTHGTGVPREQAAWLRSACEQLLRRWRDLDTAVITAALPLKS
jgi:hypothetical protein